MASPKSCSRLSISLGAEDSYPANWLDSQGPALRTEKDSRFQVRYNAQIFAILAEQLLQIEGVTILYGTYAVSVQKKADKIEAVIVENKSGRQAITVSSVVDATGDCDIAYFADAPTETFRQGNVLVAALADDFTSLNVAQLQSILQNNGVVLH